MSKALFARLFVSTEDIRYARYCAGVLIKNRWHHTQWERWGKVYERQVAFTTAMIVSYARPFTESRGWPLFPDRLIKQAYEQEERGLHKLLLNLRHTIYAHSDSEFRAVELKLDFRGDPITHVTSPVLRITADQAAQIQSMTAKLLKATHARLAELKSEITAAGLG